ncbi:MAG TPA: HtaA domain-containing protein [Solirubrobacterales bacterium]|nr:HtaA domain-containing protein [Solirubrobacterales bacterium]
MRSTRLRSLPIGLSLAVLALLTTTATAAAATIPIQGGEVDWGIKSSFRAYVKSPIAAGRIEVSGGAVEAADGTYRFPVESGTYDLETHSTSVQAKGAVHFTGHYDADEVPALDLTVADPRVVLEGETGTVFADVASKSLTTGGMEEFPGVEFATLDATAVAPSFEGEAVSLAGIPAELTEAGAKAFAGFYTAGTALDPVGVLAAFSPTPEPTPADPSPSQSSPTTSSSAPVQGPATVPTLPTLKRSPGGAVLGRGGAARIVTVACPAAQACTLRAPRNVRFKAGGRRWSAKVIAPHWILPGRSGRVAVKVPRAALAGLAGGKAKVSLRLVLGVGSESRTQVVEATLKARGR